MYLFVFVRVIELRLQTKSVFSSRQVLYYQILQDYALGTSYSTREKFLEVKNVPKLGGLCDTTAVAESLPPIIRDGILSRVCETTEHEVAAYKGTRSTLSSLAVDVYDVLGVLLQELDDAVACFCQHYHRRGVMVLPIEISDLVLEERLIIDFSTHVVNPKLITVVLLDEPGHVLNGIPVAHLQELRGWIAHRIDARSNSGDV